MKQREIDKLAWEYAEKYSGDVDYGIVTSEFIRNVVAEKICKEISLPLEIEALTHMRDGLQSIIDMKERYYQSIINAKK